MQGLEAEYQVELADGVVELVEGADEDVDEVDDGEGRLGGGADEDEVEGGELLVGDERGRQRGIGFAEEGLGGEERWEREEVAGARRASGDEGEGLGKKPLL